MRRKDRDYTGAAWPAGFLILLSFCAMLPLLHVLSLGRSVCLGMLGGSQV